MAKKSNYTVLFVDDDKRVLKSLRMWFLSEGFEPLTASNGSEALELLLENPVDVAVVDFRIGKEDGITVAQKLKEVDEDLKIIILTGFPSYETAVQAMKIGAFDYLSKASSNEKLMNVVEKAMAEREEDRAIKKGSRGKDKRVKFILFCNHSLIKERLENFSNTSSDFKLLKSFNSMDTYGAKNLGQDVHIALVCAGCHLKRLKDAYSIFPDLYRAFPGVKVLIINERCSEQEQVDLLKLGVRGFVSQDSSSDKLEKALLHINNGDLWVSRNVTQRSLQEVVSQDVQNNQKIRETFGLTFREIEILRNITMGLKNKEIASSLLISETTVKTHINRIFKKMGVDNRSKAHPNGFGEKSFFNFRSLSHSGMSLKKKLILLLAILGSFLIILCYIGFQVTLRPSQQQQKSIFAEKLKVRLKLALEVEHNKILLRSKNLADWEDMAAYVQTPSIQFENEVFPNEIFLDDEIMDLAVVCHIDTGVIFQKCYKEKRFQDGSSFNIDREISRMHSLVMRTGKSVKEIVNSNLGPVMTVGTPIITGDVMGSGKQTVGVLFLGRFIDSVMMSHISEYTMETVKDMGFDREELKEFFHNRMLDRELFYEEEKDRLNVYYLLKDIDGIPAMVLYTSLDNELFRVMNRHVFTLLIFIFLSIVALGLRIYFSIDKHIVNRVRVISENMGRIEGLNDLSKRIPDDTESDEIAHLVSDINVMLDRLENEKNSREIAERSMITNGKLASIGRLSSCIAHEVNNPLLAIGNSITVIKKISRSKSPLFKEAMEITESELNRIRDIISSLLDFHRFEKEAFDRVDVREVVNKSLNVLEWSRKLGASTKVIPQMEAGCYIYGSQMKLKQVFINFFLNAAEAMQNTTAEPTLYIWVKPSDDGEFVEVHIMDNGPGIPDDIKGHLFEPFVSTKEATGVGLGLYISYKIIDNHQGEIIYDEEYTDGTHFIIKLPGIVSNTLVEKKAV